MRLFFLFSLMLFFKITLAQNIQQRLKAACEQLQQSEQFSHSQLGMYVVETDQNQVVFAYNQNIGMAPASCTKVITSVTAFALLGADYSYKTYLGVSQNAQQPGSLIITGTGDPSLGSWRWAYTKADVVLAKIASVIQTNHLTRLNSIVINDSKFSYQPIPDGWIWQDMGNYYGAGSFGLNWHENQYDLHLSSSEKIGEKTKLLKTVPDISAEITNFITAAKKGSGDNGYIYAAPYTQKIFCTGTIPAGENDFVISGSIPNPPITFAEELQQQLLKNNISISQPANSFHQLLNSNLPVPATQKILDSITSPSFEKLNYWFLKRSINLYGETFIKTLALQNNELGSTENGLALLQNFWENKGVEKGALHMIDGSGLSTGNRISCKTLVSVLQYAQQQKWFSKFYEALPEMNGIKMKDGYINGVRAYTGYVKSKLGKNYTFAFIVNNFNGSPSAVREKMWKVLDILK